MVDNFIIKIFKAHEFGSVHMHQATINTNMTDLFFSKMLMMITLNFQTHMRKFTS
jgi:hypothetical protein